MFMYLIHAQPIHPALSAKQPSVEFSDISDRSCESFSTVSEEDYIIALLIANIFFAIIFMITSI